MTIGRVSSLLPLQVIFLLNDVDNDCDNHYQIGVFFITHWLKNKYTGLQFLHFLYIKITFLREITAHSYSVAEPKSLFFPPATSTTKAIAPALCALLASCCWRSSRLLAPLAVTVPTGRNGTPGGGVGWAQAVVVASSRAREKR